jgi:chaperone modulatory protein CbpM
MSSEEFIPATDFCTFHHVEISFLQDLHDSGLIVITTREGAAWLETEQLPVIEKFARWHYELSINPEGIEALSHVLGRFDHLMAENQRLRDRLRRFEQFASGAETHEA